MTTIKHFYINWKCEQCDVQWQQFIENRKLALLNQQNNLIMERRSSLNNL